MIRSHVVDRDEDLTNVPATTFQPSDLLILRLLAGKAPLRAGSSGEVKTRLSQETPAGKTLKS